MKLITLRGCIIIFLLVGACKTQVSTPNPASSSVGERVILNPSSQPIINYLGLNLNEISFQWELPPAAGRQSAFHIIVASNEEKLAVDVGDLWDSGIRYSNTTSGIRYMGKPLNSGAGIWWKVRVWNQDWIASAYSQAISIQAKSVKDQYSVAFLGGTTIAEMEKFGWLETALTSYWPQQYITFRNIGWPGDDVFGIARSGFGSALNTESWQPPDREDVFGMKVMMEHVSIVNPDVIVLGYGAEVAFANTEEKFAEFVQGYTALLHELQSLGVKLILLSPHRHWKIAGIIDQPDLHNKRLKRVSEIIRNLAEEGSHPFIDLFEKLVPDDTEEKISVNGIHLTDQGYKKMAKVIMTELEIADKGYSVKLTRDGNVLESQSAEVANFLPTERGYRFTLKSDRLNTLGNLELTVPHILKIDGEIIRGNSTISQVNGPDTKQIESLRRMIIEKNRLHRFRINPLNKVYTHLFRKHEMGHLAYETDDYKRLTEEKDELIARLNIPQSHRYEIELLDSWKSPRVYRDHEVPSYIPEPDIQAELDAFTITDGFDINLFAVDPQIANPISITWDNRGRAWVGTSTTYPQLKPGQERVDRIVILEDTNNDGRADKHTVFAEGLLIPHAVMPVKGGAYVSTTTELLFLSDNDGDDKADETRVIYSGFGHSDVHHTLHSMRWTPWGDLHFIQSIYINTFIETPFGPRRLNGTGIWQFRPETERLEIFSRGLVNPWGEALDDWGQVFATDGAGSQQPNYLFPGSAHNTAVGSDRIIDGLLYGKPKNTAAEFMSGSHIPDNWRGSLLANDYRANRTIRYTIGEKGSGYSAKEVETVLHSSHRSYRPVDVKLGPDGAVYIVDWYSPIIDHGEVDFYHPSRDKSHGRIWRLSSKNRRLNKMYDFQNASIDELLDMLKSSSQFTRIQANRELVTRECSPLAVKKWVSNLKIADPLVDHHRLEALWLGVALNSADEGLLEVVLQSKDHHASAAAIRMIPRIHNASQGEKIAGKFVIDKHPQVRLEAVNTLRRLASPNAAKIALRALDFEVDANLDYMLWLTARELEEQWLPNLRSGEEVFDGRFERLVFALKAINNSAAAKSLAVFVRQGKFEGKAKQDALIRIANFGESEELDMILEEVVNAGDILLLEALVAAPESNTAVPHKIELLRQLLQDSLSTMRTLAAQLYGRWQISEEKESLLNQASNTNLEFDERIAAGDALISLGDTTELIRLVMGNPDISIRSTAIVSWAKVAPQEAAEHAITLLTETDSLTEAILLIKTYANLIGGAKILAEKLSDKNIRPQIAVAGIRIAQSSGRNLSNLVEVLKEAGELKPVRLSLDSTQQRELLVDVKKSGNRRRGSQVYWRPQLLCANCHQVDGEGGELGPNLSFIGTFMTAESILESIINPNTAIKQNYETVIITKRDGSVISGTLDRRTEQGARIRNSSGKIQLVPTGEIEKFEITPISLMPPGLTSPLSYDELVDLMAFLTNLGIEDK